MADFTNEQLQADDAQYAALAAELEAEGPSVFEAGQTQTTGEEQAQGNDGNQRQPQEDAERQQRISEAASQADQWMDQLEARRQERAPAPDPQSDPLGFLQHLGSQYQHMEARSQAQAFAQAVHASEAQMRETTPDYDDACKHLESFRMAQLEEAYPDGDAVAHILARQHGFYTPAQLREAVLNQDRIAVAQQALLRRQSPAQLYYNYALKAGFRSGAQAIDNTRRGQRASGNHASSDRQSSRRVMSERQLTKLYAEDPEAFDREWERYAKAHR